MQNDIEVPVLITASVLTLEFLKGIGGVILTFVLIIYILFKLYYLIKEKR